MTADGTIDGLRDAGGFSADEPYRRALVRHRLFGQPAPTIGRFVLEDRLGAGAMGVVYRGRDPRLDRPVALKVLRGGLGELAVERLTREARALARVVHPNVVTIYEVGAVDGHPFIAMEYVAGETLATWQRGRSPSECLRAYEAAAAGLSALHAAGLVHRDFKPTNALVGSDGRVRVADLGLARAVGEAWQGVEPVPTAPSAAALTATGTLLGTPAYMAPEQQAGAPATPRSDQYALCVALVEALTGARPVGGALPRHPDLRGRLRAALSRGLSTAPADRWPDVDALVAAWSAPSARRWWPWAVAAAGAAGLMVWTLRPTPTPPPDGARLALARPSGEALTQARRLLETDPTLAATVLKSLPSDQPEWAALTRRTLTIPVARATAQLAVDVQGLGFVPGHGLVAWTSDGAAGVIRADGRLEGRADLPDAHAGGGRMEPLAPGTTPRASSTRWRAWIEPDGRARVEADGVISEPGAVVGRVIGFVAEPTGRWLAARTQDRITVWPWPADGRAVRTLAVSGPVWFIDADTLATEASDGIVRVVDLRAGRAIELRGHAQRVVHVVADATRIVTHTQARIVRIWHREPALGRHASGIWAGALDASGHRLATAGHDGTVGLLDLQQGEFRRLHGHTAPATYQVAFSPDGARLASAGGDGTVRVWSLTALDRAPRALAGHAGWAYGLGWSPDGRWLASGDRQGGVRVWSVGDPGPARLLGHHPGDSSMRRIHTLAFTSASDAVFTGAKDGSLLRWPLPTGAPTPVPSVGAGADVRRLAEGRLLAISHAGIARVLADDGSVLATCAAEASITGWAVTATGEAFATAHADGAVRVWDVTHPEAPRWALPPGSAVAEALAFDAKGARLAIGDVRGGLAVYGIGEPRPRWRLMAHGAAVRFVAFVADTLVTASFDGTIRRWAAPATPDALHHTLSARVTDCLVPSQRVAWLGEADGPAAARHAACVADGRDRRAATFGP